MLLHSHFTKKIGLMSESTAVMSLTEAVSLAFANAENRVQDIYRAPATALNTLICVIMDEIYHSKIMRLEN